MTDKRDAYLRRTYGIDHDEYDILLRAQGGVCFICSAYPRPESRLGVDHDHKTGVIRGLLCTYCNRYVVGRWRIEQVPRLCQVLRYLEDPPAIRAIGERRVPKRRRRKRR